MIEPTEASPNVLTGRVRITDAKPIAESFTYRRYLDQSGQSWVIDSFWPSIQQWNIACGSASPVA
jgi:hypothetical protein